MLKKRVFVYPLKHILYCLCLSLFSGLSYAADAQSDDLSQGEELYLLHCNDCHGRSLQGGVGFNLIDGEWIHGSQPSEIAANISKGFLTKGMPGFKGILSSAQIDNVVAYIRSKRVGFEGLFYRAWPIPSDPNINIDTLRLDRPLKKGTLHHDNLLDFTFTELKHFAFEFQAILHAPLDEDTVLNARLSKGAQVRIWIDDELVTGKDHGWSQWSWPIHRGHQIFRMHYITAGNVKGDHDMAFFISRKTAIGKKLFPLSIKAKNFLSKQKYTKKVAGLVERKHVNSLPPFSVNIGIDDRTSFAFNTRSCAIVGAWEGKELDIGPNIFNRGRFGSEIEGAWYFNSPDEISLSKSSQCEYHKYRRGAIPEIYFSVDGVEFKLTASVVSDAIRFDYDQLTGESKVKLAIEAEEKINAKTEYISLDSGVHTKTRVTVTLAKDK